MNSQRGAIPKTSMKKGRARLPSSDSEDDIGRRNLIPRRISRQGTLNSPKISRPGANCFFSDIENIIIISPSKIKKEKLSMPDIKVDETDKCMTKLNEMMKKYEKENICDLGKNNTTRKAAEEIGRAALTVSETKVLKKNYVVDLRHKALKRGNVVKVEPQTLVTLNSNKTVTASKFKPILMKNTSKSTTVTISVKNSAAVPKEPALPSKKHGPQRVIPSYNAVHSANSTAAPKKYNPASSKHQTIKISILNNGFATEIASKSKNTEPKKVLSLVGGKRVPKSNVLKNKEPQDVKTVDLSSPLVSKTLRTVEDSPTGGLILECPVCFEHLLLGRPTVITSCGHMFCRKCMDTIKFNSNKCPICRIDILHVIDIHV